MHDGSAKADQLEAEIKDAHEALNSVAEAYWKVLALPQVWREIEVTRAHFVLWCCLGKLFPVKPALGKL